MQNSLTSDHADHENSCGIPSIYPVSVTVKRHGDSICQGMGRTLNISKTGILLETCFPAETGLTLSISLALENALIDLEGQVIACRKGGDDRFEIGVRFLPCEHFSYETLKKFVDRFKNLRQTEEYA